MTTTTTPIDRTEATAPDRTTTMPAAAGSDRRRRGLRRLLHRPAKPLTPEQAHAAEVMRTPDRVLAWFYVSVLGIALYGQVSGLTHAHHWFVVTAMYAGVTLELLGVALATYADARRALGERARFARLFAATAAGLACFINWTGHDHKGPHWIDAYFYTSLSVVAFLAFLIRSGARRRDALRGTGQMAAEPPVYELWHDWMRHPAVTARARNLAKVDPKLGLEGSRRAAREAINAEKRDTALAAVLRQRIAAKVGGDLAEIAARTYDLHKIAAALREAADYTALAELIGRDLTPERLAGPDREQTRTRRTARRRGEQDRTAYPGPDRTDQDQDPDRSGPDPLDDLDRTLDEIAAAGADRTGPEPRTGPDPAGGVHNLDDERAKIRETLILISERYGDRYPSWEALLAAVSGERMRADLKIGKTKVNAARQHTDLLPWPTDPLAAGGDG